MIYIFEYILLFIPVAFFVYLIFSDNDKDDNLAYFGALVLMYLFIISYFILKLCLHFGVSI